ncbi:MAG TPA: VTT domain-containing protein, partial [Cyclobacteriaceae bacterium]|nr:VTT domain-containing protein [Cyclobacteriaceae bacterium]
MRLLLIFIVLAALVLTSFFLFGDTLMNTFTQEGSIAWLSDYGSWAWAAGLMLLIGDLLLPIPATLVMSALGYLYGPFIGGFLSTFGSFAAGSLGYWICRLLGERAALRLLGAKDFERGKKLSGKLGGWIVALSR